MIGLKLDMAFLRTLTVLYAEDEPTTREEIGAFLRRRTGTLVTAGDGEAGLAAFRARPAQVIVTDIRMPVMDGLAMAREIRKLDPGVLLVVTTAFEDEEYLARAVETGIDQYVVKPIQQARLEFALLTCAHRLRAAGAARAVAAPLTPEEEQLLTQLSAREREVLGGIGRGLPSREIGLALGISARTVHAHQAHLMLKLGVHKATALASLEIRGGIR